MITIAITYDVVTPESAEQGDLHDHGFWAYGGWRYSMDRPHIAADIIENPRDYSPVWKPGALRDAIECAQSTLGIYEPSCYPFDGESPTWWSSTDPDVDYSSGEDTYYSLHVSGITPSTRRRIHRLLNGEPIFG